MGSTSRPNTTKVELKKGPWTREEDQKLLAYIQEHGNGSWSSLPAKAGLERCGKSCRLRWTNYLRPDIKRGKFSTPEEKTIIRLHALLGNRWSAIATHLPKRTDNEIKNYWNTRLKKRLTRMGIDPTTHKPKTHPAGSANAANLSHMAQWETARLEAEARLARESKFRLLNKFGARPPLTAAVPAPLPCLDVLKVWKATGGGPNSFFGTAPGRCIESPTSTLNFSCNIEAGKDVVPASGRGGTCVNNKDNVKSSTWQPHVDDRSHNLDLDDFYGCEEAGPVDLAARNYGYGEGIAEEFEDSRNYWNELLNMVSSPPMEWPRF